MILRKKNECLICGKAHSRTTPECKFKSSIASTLYSVLNADNASFLIDKTPFLKHAWMRFRRGKK